MSRKKFESYCVEMAWDVPGNFQYDDKVAIIEILDTQPGINQWAWFQEDDSRILKLWFDDTETGGFLKAFDEEQADKIFKFFEANKSICNKWIVHCAAGVSRSGAVGRWIFDVFKAEGTKCSFPEHNRIHPNGLVSMRLNKYFNNY